MEYLLSVYTHPTTATLCNSVCVQGFVYGKYNCIGQEAHILCDMNMKINYHGLGFDCKILMIANCEFFNQRNRKVTLSIQYYVVQG